MNSTPARIITSRIERAIERFPALDSEHATIAFSGGKDSVALAVALQTMGRNVSLKAIDMGYSAAWAPRIKSLSAALGLSVDVIELDSLIESTTLASSIASNLQIRTAALREIGRDTSGRVTPCTNCYNCKLLSLVGTANYTPLLFAHHHTDMMASFLKSALMYYDRWVLGNITYDRGNFRKLALESAGALSNSNSTLFSIFLGYLEMGVANTSEPPIESNTIDDVAYQIHRPLVFAEEQECSDFASSLNVRLESSGCGHTSARESRTAREIVQFEMLPAITERGGSRSISILSEEILNRLDDGQIRSDARRSRETILGTTYKASTSELGNKL